MGVSQWVCLPGQLGPFAIRMWWVRGLVPVPEGLCGGCRLRAALLQRSPRVKCPLTGSCPSILFQGLLFVVEGGGTRPALNLCRNTGALLGTAAGEAPVLKPKRQTQHRGLVSPPSSCQQDLHPHVPPAKQNCQGQGGPKMSKSSQVIPFCVSSPPSHSGLC